MAGIDPVHVWHVQSFVGVTLLCGQPALGSLQHGSRSCATCGPLRPCCGVESLACLAELRSAAVEIKTDTVILGIDVLRRIAEGSKVPMSPRIVEAEGATHVGKCPA
jgi:hypothetical protein